MEATREATRLVDEARQEAARIISDAKATAERVRSDAKEAAALGEYAGRRERAPRTADGQWKLALWCEANGLGAEARAIAGNILPDESGGDRF